jgi:small conductance mechanosensitive channel
MNQIKAVLETGIGGFTLATILGAVILAVVCLIVVKVLLNLLDRAIGKMKVDPTLLGILRATVKVLLLFLVVLIVMGYLNIPVTSLVAVLSVVGLAVSLSVQNFLSNVAGGLQLLASHPFKVGDYVEAGGCSGTVREIGLFYTKILTVDNKLIQMPNSSVVSANITNYSSESLRRVDLNITASYDAPVEQVKRSLRTAVEHTAKTLVDPAPMARVSGYKDSSIEYVVRVWCRNEDYWDVYFDLLEEIKATFDRDGVEMTYDHLNVHMMPQ